MHDIINSVGHGSVTARMSLLKQPCGKDDVNIKLQIHKIEKEAYSSVLKAFIAQSDFLSWGKEGLITELRKELNVTDIEHGQLLVEINKDDSIKRIREWQKGPCESLSSKPYSATTPSVVPAPFTNDRQTLSGNCMKSVHIVDHSIQETHNNRGGSVKSQLKQGFQVPDSGHIKNCIRKDGRNIQGPLSCRARLAQSQLKQGFQAPDCGNFKSHVNMVDHHTPGAVSGRGGPVHSQLRKGFLAPDSGDLKNCSEVIELRVTDELIHEVEEMTDDAKNFDPVQIEKAKLILREHERAILEALDKLADVSDEDDYVDPHHYSYEDLQVTRVWNVGRD